jgi:hypothetical protein
MNVDYVKSRLQYDPNTGDLRWKPRDVNRPNDKRWNKIWVGVRAGCLHHRGHIVIGLDGKFYQAGRLIWFMENGPKGRLYILMESGMTIG